MTTRADVKAQVAQANRDLKSEVLVVASDIVTPRTFTSGSLSLDVALGGGWPGNRWVQVIGKWTAGKTAIALKTLAANMHQDPDFTAFWLAAEHYDSDQAQALGVDNSRVILAPVQSMELGLDLVLEAVESKVYDAIVVDSYPALLTKQEGEKTMDEFSTADGARKFNQFWRKAGSASHRAYDNTDRPFLGIIINQYRDKIGGPPQRFGVPQTSPGGHGQDYAYYTRLEVARQQYIKESRPGVEDPVAVGQTLKLTTIKNKAAAPQQIARVDFYFRDAPLTGFRRGDYDLGKEYVMMGTLFHVLKRLNGSYLEFEGEKFNGKPAVIQRVLEDVDFKEALGAQVLAIARDPRKADTVVAEDLETRRTVRK